MYYCRRDMNLKLYYSLRYWLGILAAVTCLLSLVHPPAISRPGYPLIKNFSPAEYGGGIQNYEIEQDFRGIIYIANNFGLLEYDGHSWHTYAVPNGTKVRTIDIADNGRIYIGCQNDFGYFFPDERGIYQFTSLADSLPDSLRNLDETWKVFVKDQKVFFATFNNVFVYEQNKLQAIHLPHPAAYTYFVRDKLYIHNETEGLYEYVNGAIRHIKHSEIFRSKLIADIIPFDNNRDLIITYNNGCYLFDGINFSKWNHDLESITGEATVRSGLRLLDGKIVLGTQNNGLYIFNRDGSLSLHMSKDEGLINRTVLSLFQDITGNLWIGSNNGISLIEISSPFCSINETMGLQGTGYAAYLNENGLYLGTNNGLFFTDSGSLMDGYHANSIKNLGLNAQVYRIQEVKDQLLVAHHEGAYYLRGNKPVKFSPTMGTWTFLQLKADPDLMVSGTYNGLALHQWTGNEWKYVKNLKGFYESSRLMELDDYGNIWMAHGYKGLYKIRLNEQQDSIAGIQFYNEEDGFPSHVLISVYKIRNELVFTSQRGVYRYNKSNDNFEPHPFYNKYFGDATIMDLEEDAMGNIYAIADNKLVMLKRNNKEEYEVIDKCFNRINGMFNDDLMNVTALEPDHILVGAKEGFIYFNASTIEEKTAPFSLNMRSVELISGKDSLIFQGSFYENEQISKAQTPNFELTLPYQFNSLKFAFSGTFYVGNQPLQYQFYLKNFEKEWSSWTTKTEKEYTNLPEGNFTFLVRAKNLYGTISEPMEYKFTIEAPWYRTKTAYFLYTLFGFSIIGISMGVVDWRHRKARKTLVSEQKKELSMKESELEHVTRQSEEAITELKNEKLTAEVRHKNNELATSTMHMIHKNEFIADIKSRISNVVKKENNKDVKATLNRIIKDIDQNINHDKDWENFHYHFDRVHGDFMKRVTAQYPELTAQEIKLCAFLRLNLSTKEIAQLLHISVRGVEIARYRLRKKLDLNRDVNLTKFVLEF